MHRPRAARARARAPRPADPPRAPARAAPEGRAGPAVVPGGKAPRRSLPLRDTPAARPGAPGGAPRARRVPRVGSSPEQPLDDRPGLGPRLTQLRGVTRACGGEVRPAPSLPPRDCRDRIGDVTRLHPLLYQIVGDGDVHAGALAVREQHGDRALMARAERVHDEPDLIAVLEVGVRDVELDVTDAFHASRFPLPASRLQ